MDNSRGQNGGSSSNSRRSSIDATEDSYQQMDQIQPPALQVLPPTPQHYRATIVENPLDAFELDEQQPTQRQQQRENQSGKVLSEQQHQLSGQGEHQYQQVQLPQLPQQSEQQLLQQQQQNHHHQQQQQQQQQQQPQQQSQQHRYETERGQVAVQVCYSQSSGSISSAPARLQLQSVATAPPPTEAQPQPQPSTSGNQQHESRAPTRQAKAGASGREVCTSSCSSSGSSTPTSCSSKCRCGFTSDSPGRASKSSSADCMYTCKSSHSCKLTSSSSAMSPVTSHETLDSNSETVPVVVSTVAAVGATPEPPAPPPPSAEPVEDNKPANGSEQQQQLIDGAAANNIDGDEIDSLDHAISVVVIKNGNIDSNIANSVSINASGINKIVVGHEASLANLSGADSEGSSRSGSCRATCRNGKYCPECCTGRPTSGDSDIKCSDSIIIAKRQMLEDQEASTSGRELHFSSSKTGGNLAIGPNRYTFISRDDNITSELFGTSSNIITDSRHFEIIWSNLSYRIEPKWYKKVHFLDILFSHFIPAGIDNHSSATSTVSSSAGMNDNQHQMHAATSTNCTDSLSNGNQPKAANEAIEIFTNLNGSIKSGQLTAILGPSGAGKTTLLNCLTGKLRKSVSGTINLIGANGKHLKMCTIPQKDHLLDLLTVEENLWFASKIKNPEYGFDHAKNIERVIDLLGLKRCRSAKIKKISGGQHKRVSIAQELLSNPDILVLDEPTSGLDSLTCFKTISMLRDLVELSASNEFMKPMAIIVTIHQPQPKVFNLFHHVYILANGGRAIYEGSPLTSLQTITSVSGLEPMESAKSSNQATGFVDPASFLIEIASEEYGSEPIKLLGEYQRRTFCENNGIQYIQEGYLKDPLLNIVGKNFSATRLHTADNPAFAPEFDPLDEEEPTRSGLYVHNQIYNLNNNDNNNTTKDSDKKTKNDRQMQRMSIVSVDVKKGSRIKKRRKSSYSIESGTSSSKKSSQSVITTASSASTEGSFFMSEQLKYTREANHKGKFWSHTGTLAHRTLLTIRRDPLLMTSRVLFHLMIPILMRYVYGKSTGAANACPNYEPEIDITQISSMVESKRIESMLEELHMSIENVSMFFIIMYAFAAAVLALNALSFPLNMQVLLKETRNGWYSMSSYVLAKTLADLPLELTMPTLTMALVYPLTGQPSSYLQWRAVTICLIMTLCSLVAQTQALILGALVMNSVQTAVFVSQASQLPWVILAGFTIRIKRLSEPLKVISLTSFYRLGCEAITLTRYGFGICPCDPKQITGKPVKLVGIPDQIRTVAQYWLDSMEASRQAGGDSGGADESMSDANSTLVTTTAATISEVPKADIFQHLANQLSYANSYGVNITSCDDVAPDRIRAINLTDDWLVARICHLFIMLIIMKFVLYHAVKFSINIRL